MKNPGSDGYKKLTHFLDEFKNTHTLLSTFCPSLTNIVDMFMFPSDLEEAVKVRGFIHFKIKEMLIMYSLVSQLT